MGYPIPSPNNSSLFFNTEKEAILALWVESRKLHRIAMQVMYEYYNSYTPHPDGYKRTWKTPTGIKMTAVRRKGAIGFEARVTFENSAMYHNSYVHSSQPQGHSIMLISSGWHSKKLEERIGVRQRYTRYKGFNYLGEVMARYINVKNKRVSVRTEWTGKSNFTR